jgi:large subunit ribosomal protein L24
MKANQPVSLKIKKGDTVKVLVGSNKGKTGKVLSVLPAEQKVLIEKIGVRKRHIRPNQLNPRGGTKDIHIPMHASKVALVIDEKGTTSRVGTSIKKDGTKARIAKKTNKEIK